MSTTATPPPSARMVRDAVELLADLVEFGAGGLDGLSLRVSADTLLRVHERQRAQLAEVHRQLAQYRHRADAVRVACQEAGRYVDTVDVERALDERPAAPGTI